MARDMTQPDDLVLRAAWLHFVGGMTQAAVAKKLGVPSVKAHRMIAKAVADGLVHVTIDGDVVECIELEEALCQRFGLDSCDVAPDLAEDGAPVKALSRAGAKRLRWWMQSGEIDTIGVGHGRTLAAIARELPKFDGTAVRFVSLMGELARNYTANPHTVMDRLSQRTGAQAFVFPVPLFANSANDREVLLAQRGVSEVFTMAQAAPLKLLGIGAVHPDNHLVRLGMISSDEIKAISQAGAVAEIMGHFFTDNGDAVPTVFSDRTLAPDLDNSRIVAIAGGPAKAQAIKAILKSGKLSGLVTDECTARDLLRDSGVHSA